MRKKAVIFLSALLAVFFLASASMAQGQSGTTLSAEKTAVGKCYRIYEWEISKEVNPTSITQYVGETTKAYYTVTVTKTGYKDMYCVEGLITVTNGGSVATENLTLADRVQYSTGGGFVDLPGATQIITPAQLAPQQTKQYQYKICFEPVQGATYRNVVKVTITNHSGHLGIPFGPEPKADFSLPNQCTQVNDTIHVIDSNLPNSQWQTNQSTSWQYNLPFPCQQPGGYNHPNTACIVETQQCANANVQVTCLTTTTTSTTITTTSTTTQTTTTTMQLNTRTIGYWKNHSWPGSVKICGKTINETLGKKILKDAKNNNFSMLIAQLIAAKLNVLALNINTPAIITNAENWLCQQGVVNGGSWWNTKFASKSQKQTATNYKNALDAFNNYGTY